VELRLHTGGRTRGWLGRQFGGDEQLGDRIWRRMLHLAGGIVLAVYLLPRGFFVLLPTDEVLLIALAAVLTMEAVRRAGGLQLPTIRPHEVHRTASYAYFAVGLTFAVEIFPKYVAIPVVLGAVLVDPLMGELRLHAGSLGFARGAGVAAYTALAVPWLVLGGPWSWPIAAALGLLGAVLAISVEGPRTILPLDDDAAMVLFPGIILAVAAWVVVGVGPIPAF
jgi:hypothetical protein